MINAAASLGEIISICPEEMVASAGRFDPERFTLRVPAHWKAERTINKHAERIQAATLDWFRDLGFSKEQLQKVWTFQPSHYSGIPFPLTGPKETLLISKYLSLWLLWDDVDIESGENAWKLNAHHVLSGNAPAHATRFDMAWLSLLQELAETMSAAWINALCKSMATWSDAALAETQLALRWRTGTERISFAETLQSRIDTIGMYATAYLVEYANGIELPQTVHEHETIRAMKTLANKIVGLGNDIFSAGKDYATGYVNVFFALQGELSIPTTDALARVVQMHNDAMIEYDRLASSLPSFGAAWDPLIVRWVNGLRYASLGFSVWESGAPRYSKFKLVVNGRVVEPAFSYYTPAQSVAV